MEFTQIIAKRLEESLHGVVESCVNVVGVDLNTASASLLLYVAGLKPAVAKNIVAWRDEHGKFSRRDQLKKIPRLGAQTYIQCAGFIRLPDGVNPLENTPVHPESYKLAEDILRKIGHTSGDLRDHLSDVRKKLALLEPKELADEFCAGVPTVRDILDALQRPGRDGLVHISQLSDKFIKHPLEAVAVGDIVKVRVIGIDKARERVSLSMRDLTGAIKPV